MNLVKKYASLLSGMVNKLCEILAEDYDDSNKHALWFHKMM